MKNGRDLVSRARDWLETQGYPLEMAVAHAFQKNGFKVLQSDRYRDVKSGEYREIDVVAYREILVRHRTIRFIFVLECKTSRDKPWILFVQQADPLSPAEVLAQTLTLSAGLELLELLAECEDVKRQPLLSMGLPPAYGVTQAFTSGRDLCYEASMAVASAATSYVQDDRYRGSAREKPIQFVFPMIVVDGEMLTATLNLNDEVDVAQCTRAMLWWGAPGGPSEYLLIRLLQRRETETFCVEAARSIAAMMAHCFGELAPAIPTLK